MPEMVKAADSKVSWDTYLARPDVVKRFESALPSVGITGQRFVRMAMTAFTMNPNLYKCSRDSILRCLIYSAQMGLAPTGRGGVWIVPFGSEATPVPDYRGLVAVARRSGKIIEFATGVVYEGDEFDFEKGTNSFLKHKAKLTNEPRTNDKIIAFYAYAKLEGGGFEFEAMSRADVDYYRGKSRAKNSGPWVSDYPAMGRKTAALRLCNLLPMQSDDQRLLELASRDQEGLPMGLDKEINIADMPKADATVTDEEPVPPTVEEFDPELSRKLDAEAARKS